MALGVIPTKKLRAPPVAQTVKNPPAMQETQVWSVVRKIPWRMEWLPTLVFLPGKSQDRMEEPCGLQSMGSRRVGPEIKWLTLWLCNKDTLMVKEMPKQERTLGKMLLPPLLLQKYLKFSLCYAWVLVAACGIFWSFIVLWGFFSFLSCGMWDL